MTLWSFILNFVYFLVEMLAFGSIKVDAVGIGLSFAIGLTIAWMVFAYPFNLESHSGKSNASSNGFRRLKRE